MQKELLKETIRKKGMSVTFVAKKLGITRETFYNRMEKGNFRASEIVALADVLSLNQEEKEQIFFAPFSELNSR